MINIEHLIPKLKEYFSQEENIITVWIVGSYVTSYQRKDSDIDFAILFDKDISVLDEMYYAGEITQVLQIEDVDTINLRKAPVTLQMKALQEGRKIYEKDSIKTSDFIEYVLKVYPDKKYDIDKFQKDAFEKMRQEVMNSEHRL